MSKSEGGRPAELNALLDEVGASAQLSQREVQLEFLALRLLSADSRVSDYVLQGGTPNEADLSEFWTGGSGDGEIDGLFYDPTSRSVTIIQATHRSKWGEDVAGKARSFFARLPEWEEAALGSGSERLSSKSLDLLRDSELSRSNSDIRLVFVTNIPIGSEPASKLFEIAEAQTSAYREAGVSVVCEVWGQAEILREYEEIQNTYSYRGIEPTTVNFKNGTFFQLDQPHRTVVGALSVNELRNLYNKRGVRNVLFNSNIRMALGGKNKINKDMSGTLLASPGDFFYFNNGVTATCATLQIEGNRVHVEGLQVVNGAQTVSTIGNSPIQDGEALVLFRIIETGDKYRNKNEFPDLITKYQNTQNPVKASDFFSTDDFQEWLRVNLATRCLRYVSTRQFWYSHKRGYQDKKPLGVKIEMETLAKLRHSMLVDPNRTYNAPRDFWDNEKYWEAFGSQGTEVSAWNEDEIAEIAWGITTYLGIREYVKEESRRNRDSLNPNPETGYLAYLAFFATALSFQFIKFLQSIDEAPSFAEIMSSKSDFERYSRVLVKVREIIADAISTRSSKRESNPKFYLARDKDEFRNMLTALKNKHASHLMDLS